MRLKGWLILALAVLAGPATRAADAPPPPSVNIDQIKVVMTGTWQNVADTRFTREFNADGTSIDRYDGDDTATIAGTWKLIDGAHMPPDLVARKLPAEGVYLTLSEHGDRYLFALISVSPQAMQMLNVDRRQTLEFARLK